MPKILYDYLPLAGAAILFGLLMYILLHSYEAKNGTVFFASGSHIYTCKTGDDFNSTTGMCSKQYPATLVK